MANPPTADPALLAMFKVRDPALIEQTAIATVWKVQRADHSFAALKVYPKAGMGAEAAGFDLLQALAGNTVAQIYARNSHAALIEWLDGPSLGDLSRSGQDHAANATLVDVACRLHAAPLATTLRLPHLQDWFAALFALTFGENCPPRAKAGLIRCQALATTLLKGQCDVRPLHGDLHHDNIRLGARGYCAFDAKGVLGERNYELANAFRNPKGASAIVQNPARIRGLAVAWSVSFEVDTHRLLTWAAVKTALSIAWRSGGVAQMDDEYPLLTMFLQILDGSA
jgi:streptomycin 6-kinase